MADEEEQQQGEVFPQVIINPTPAPATAPAAAANARAQQQYNLLLNTLTPDQLTRAQTQANAAGRQLTLADLQAAAQQQAADDINNAPAGGNQQGAAAGNLDPGSGDDSSPDDDEVDNLLQGVPEAAKVQVLKAMCKVYKSNSDKKKPTKTTSVMENKLPQFSGRKDDRAAADWFQKAESAKVQYDWTDQQFMEACMGAMTKQAEHWVNLQKKMNARGSTDSFSTLAKFKSCFLKTFGKHSLYWDMGCALSELKQNPKEDVTSFYLRVEEACVEYYEDFLLGKSWMVIAPDPGRGLPANDKWFLQEGAIMFAREYVQEVHFIKGLKQSYQTQLRKQQSHYKKLGISLLEAAEELEQADEIGSASANAQLFAVNHYSPQPPQGQWRGQSNQWTRGNSSRGRGGYGGRGGRGMSTRGRGGQNYATPFKPGSGYDKLNRIQNRNRQVHCKRCHQWGKHYTNECRQPWSQVSALEFMDPTAKPKGPAQDAYYDNLTQWPGDALPQDPADVGHNSVEAIEAVRHATEDQGNY